MAYDLIGGDFSLRDWSIGVATDLSPKGKPKLEVWNPTQAKGLMALVDNEIQNNMAMAMRRQRAKTLPAADAKAFAEFHRRWSIWKGTKGLPGKEKSRVVDVLKNWRTENADWTKKLSETARGPAGGRGVSITTLEILAVGKPRKTTWEKWKIFAGLGAVFGLGLFLGKR